MRAHQAPSSLGFSRQEHWSGLSFPSPMHESKKWKWSHSVVSDSLQPHGLQPTRLLRPWDFPGKSTGVGAITFSHLGSPRWSLRPLYKNLRFWWVDAEICLSRCYSRQTLCMFCCLLNLTPINLECLPFSSVFRWPPFIGPVSDFTWEVPEFVNQHREDENVYYARLR